MRHFATISLLGALVGCSASHCGDEPDTKLFAIKAKTEDSLLSPVSAAPYLMAVFNEDTDPHRVICTATRIAQGVALTAAHCFEQDAVFSLRTASVQAAALRDPNGEDCATIVETTPITELIVHPNLDVALARFLEADSAPGLALMPWSGEAQDAQITGFGLTEGTERGALRMIAARIQQLTEGLLEVQGVQGGACVGDSGGPLLVARSDAPEILGVLSYGSASCWGYDYYVPSERFSEWLAESLQVD